MKQIRRLLREAYFAHKDGHDTLWVISGNEGMGKSNLMLIMVEEWGKLTNQKFTIENVALTPEQWIHAIDIAEPKIGIAPFDEAGDGLFSRDAITSFSNDVAKMYTVIRAKGLLTILVIPSFWYLDKFFRMHRTKGLFFVYSRGRVAFWNKQQIKNMIIKGEDRQDVWSVDASIRDGFPAYHGDLLEDYERLKTNKVRHTIELMSEKYSNKPTELQQKFADKRSSGMMGKDIAKEFNCSPPYVSQQLKIYDEKIRLSKFS